VRQEILKSNGPRLMGVGWTQTSCREEQDGADDRNQHPDRVYFGNGRRVFFMPSLVEAVIVYIAWIGVRQYRQKQNGGQSADPSNAVVKSRNRHAIIVRGIQSKRKA
jgi:hypothetical protein